MEIIIPGSFQLMGHTYKVKLVKKVDKQDNYGEIDYEKKLIRLKKLTKEYNPTMVEEKFFHEMTHAILDELEYTQLSHDEVFIERFSRALYQAIKTAE